MLLLVGVAFYRFCFKTGGPISAAGKGVVITGAASGIGLAITKELMTNARYRGVHVYATDASQRSMDENLGPLKAASEQSGGSRLTVLSLDVTKQEDVTRVREAVEANGDFFAVVNNAGVANGYPRKLRPDGSTAMVFQGVDELEVPDVYHIWDINVFGVLRVTREFMKILPPNGAVVSIASIAGLFSGPFFGYYAMTKHAIVSLMDSLRRENLSTAFRFVTICPGFVRTPLLSLLNDLQFDEAHSRHAKTAEARMTTNRVRLHEKSQSPEHVAQVICGQAIFRHHPVPIILIDRPIARFIYRLLSIAPARFSDLLMRFI